MAANAANANNADNENSAASYDVIIVGGGPAGSTAAYFLRQAGRRVLVLEKAHLPRYKTCGGGLSPRFLRETFPFSFKPVLKTEVNAIAYIFRGQMLTVPLRNQPIGMVMRADLDAYLLRRARCEVIEGAPVCRVSEDAGGVEVETQDGRTFHAAYLIGADGSNSVVARALGLRRRPMLVAAIEAEVTPLPAVMQRFGDRPVFIFSEIHGGYAWIFPKPDHLSVGIASYHPKPGELQRKLAQVMQRLGISLEDAQLHGHPIPLYDRPRRAATARALLVGDAAGLADPLSGEGIRYAIKSGKLAAEAILHNRIGRYSRDLFFAIGLNQTLALVISWLFYRFQDLFLFFGAPNPFTTQALIDLLADRMTVLEFVLASLLSLPLFALTELAADIAEGLGRQALAARIRAAIYPEDVQGITISSAWIGSRRAAGR